MWSVVTSRGDPTELALLFVAHRNERAVPALMKPANLQFRLGCDTSQLQPDGLRIEISIPGHGTARHGHIQH